jgi:signal transduction histidine kinase
LYEEGLGEALAWLGKQMEAKQGLKVDVRIEDGAPRCDGNVSLMLYHSARELIFNIVKHAGVDRARVALAREGANGLRLSIEDDGAGYDPGAVRESTGLFSIRERMTYLGGSMEVRAALGRGTRVDLVVPLQLPASSRGGGWFGPAAAENK